MSDLHICKLFQSIGKLRMTKLEIIITVVIASLCVLSSPAAAADPAATNSPAVANSQMIAPLDRVATTDKGKLTNPLVATPEIVAEGRELYQANTCGACHGGNGKGAHGPSLANGVWVYGNDDDTIFRLVTLGSEELLSRGYSRG
ncbi:MAG: c-type cytochrome, partial [Hyphomicrobium aestuarii]|nr:c-type cytochrome [Hyphomicrobium aestuarii]